MTSETQVRAGVYGRESQGEQRSIEDQLADGRAEADGIGWAVVDTYADSVSASRHARRPRDDWPRLLADVKTGRINGVVIRDTSRADRKVSDWALFLDLCRDKETLLRSVTEHETYDCGVWRDYEYLVREGLRNAGESERLGGRALRGHTSGHTAGRPTGGPAPFGYRRIRRMEGTTKIVEQEQDPAAAEVVRWTFKEIAAGTPITQVCARLDQESPKDSSATWHHSHIHKLIANKAYIGLRKRNSSAPTKGNWPAIVDEETFHAANRVMSANRGRWRPGRTEHWLSGAMRCACDRPDHTHPGTEGVCGGRVAANPGKPDGYKYQCADFKGCAAVDAEEAEEYIFDAMVAKFADEQYVPELLRRAESSNAEAAAARVEVERLAARKREWEARLVDESDSDVADTILNTIRGINAKIKTAERKLSEVSVPPALRVLFGDLPDWDADSLTLTLPPGIKDHYGEHFDDFVRGFDFHRRWLGLSIPARRGVIRDLMEIRLFPSGRGRKLPIEQRLSYRFR